MRSYSSDLSHYIIYTFLCAIFLTSCASNGQSNSDVNKSNSENKVHQSQSSAAESTDSANAMADELQDDVKDPLQNRLQWNRAGEETQDKLISEVGVKLGSSFKHLETKKYTCGGVSQRIATFLHVSSGLKLNLIPGGLFKRGSNLADDEKIITIVRIPAMLIGQTEVTQAQWDAIGGTDNRQWKGSNLPIETVSWFDCTEWLKTAGDGLRLPSEAEWEYACRAGTQTKFSFGDNVVESNDYMWHGMNSGCITHNVAEKKPNAFGLYDMHGNVWEWCQDVYAETYKDVPETHEPYSKPGKNRVVRSVSSGEAPRHCYSSNRSRMHPKSTFGPIGFRVAKAIE